MALLRWGMTWCEAPRHWWRWTWSRWGWTLGAKEKLKTSVKTSDRTDEQALSHARGYCHPSLTSIEDKERVVVMCPVSPWWPELWWLGSWDQNEHRTCSSGSEIELFLAPRLFFLYYVMWCRICNMSFQLPWLKWWDFATCILYSYTPQHHLKSMHWSQRVALSILVSA